MPQPQLKSDDDRDDEQLECKHDDDGGDGGGAAAADMMIKKKTRVNDDWCQSHYDAGDALAGLIGHEVRR